MAKRSYGGGTIDERGDNTYRLRYLIELMAGVTQKRFQARKPRHG
jgi:hypothetical protein